MREAGPGGAAFASPAERRPTRCPPHDHARTARRRSQAPQRGGRQTCRPGRPVRDVQQAGGRGGEAPHAGQFWSHRPAVLDAVGEDGIARLRDGIDGLVYHAVRRSGRHAAPTHRQAGSRVHGGAHRTVPRARFKRRARSSPRRLDAGAHRTVPRARFKEGRTRGPGRRRGWPTCGAGAGRPCRLPRTLRRSASFSTPSVRGSAT